MSLLENYETASGWWRQRGRETQRVEQVHNMVTHSHTTHKLKGSTELSPQQTAWKWLQSDWLFCSFLLQVWASSMAGLIRSQKWLLYILLVTSQAHIYTPLAKKDYRTIWETTVFNSTVFYSDQQHTFVTQQDTRAFPTILHKTLGTIRSTCLAFYDLPVFPNIKLSKTC